MQSLQHQRLVPNPRWDDFQQPEFDWIWSVGRLGVGHNHRAFPGLYPGVITMVMPNSSVGNAENPGFSLKQQAGLLQRMPLQPQVRVLWLH